VRLFSGLSIRQRLIRCLAVLVAVSVVQVSASSFLQWQMRGYATRQKLMADVQRNQMFGDMKHDAIQGDMFRLGDAMQRHDAPARDRAFAGLRQDIDGLTGAYAFVFSQTYPEGLQKRVDDTIGPERDYIERAKAAADRLLTHPEDARGEMDSFTASFDRFEHVQDTLKDALTARMDADSTAADRLMLVALGLMLVTILAGAAALGWAGLFVWREVVEPITRLTATLQAMAHGDYAEEITGDEAGDEVAQMAAAAAVFRETALAKMMAEMEQEEVVTALSTGLSKLAAQDLEYRIQIQFPDNYERLRTDFNSAQMALAQAIGSVRVGANSVMKAITEIRAATDDLSRRNEQQAASLEETAAAMSQVTEGVAETATRAMSVRETIAQAHDEASEGGTVVNRAIEAMAGIERSAQEITSIIDVIDGIAFQTNLLALNAGVEAARAGDAGKGFAVVASEVRALAQRSAAAAQDIKELITTSTGQVDAGVALVGETGALLGKIVARVGEVTGLIGEIAGSAEVQAGSIRQVNGAVGEMDLMTQQNAAMVEETTASTRSLSEEAEQLASLVRTFRTRDVEAREEQAGNVARLRRRRTLASEDMMAPEPQARGGAVAGNLALAPSPADGDWSAF